MIFDRFTPKFYKLMFGQIMPGNYCAAKADHLSHALVRIRHAHHEVHEGHYFRSGLAYTLANGNVATFGIITPLSKTWPHMTWTLTATADGAFDLLEDVTSFSGGAAVIPLNHNRNSINDSKLICTKGMTGVDLITPTGGTTILSASLGTGKGSAIERDNGEEFILKENSKYLFRYTNGTSANIIQFVLQWYEHTNGDCV